MRALTSIGEIGLICGEREVLLRPSLRAMDSLGDPEDIVKLFADVFAYVPEPTPFPEYNSFLVKQHWERTTWAAYAVIKACTDEDITSIIGHGGTRYGSFVPGIMPMDNMVPIARSLLKHGIIGDLPRSAYGEAKAEDKNSNEVSKFEARVYVSLATTHLQYSEKDAWDMTVTSFVLAMQAKLGKADKGAPKAEDVDETQEFLDRVNEARGGKTISNPTQDEFDAAMAGLSRAPKGNK